MNAQRPDYAEQNECNRLLAECKPFARMSPETRAAIARLMRRRHFEAGQPLMRQGDPGDSLMVLSAGDASVVLELPEQQEKILRVVMRTDVVGEMALITQESRSATVRANGPVEAFVLPAGDFEELARKHSQVTVVMTDLLSERLGTTRVDAMDNKLMRDYRVTGCLARGAMAIVYEAVREGTNQIYALKMMDHRLSYNSAALARFQREAAIAEEIEHPNLVHVYEKFECYRTFFLVMELCDGPSLAQVVETDGRVPEPIVRAILGQLYAGLTHLHEHGITHRDVKPSNVLSRRDGTIKLADFGLARPRFDPHLTDAGVVVGTPAYMAPEQFETSDIDGSVDFYALGCLAYGLLTGKPLFEEATLPALMARKMALQLPPRAQIHPDLSEDLYELLRILLRHRPEERVPPAALLRSWTAPIDPAYLTREEWDIHNIAHDSTASIQKGGGDVADRS